ncbi:MFS transporter [Roseitalea porphyridii]|uniref:MFS transporter n=1 Tax=Roseitalea porphyridii TaxID=1852022 RepID=A0A4P6V2R2_9HYPH|nr:MFS transporter [Roseitalea porphyridii]QBK31024.1 MFS transporter [Roseitalea porphyridii]
MPFIRFVANNARWIVGGFLLTFFSSFGQTFFISLSAGDIRAEYGLTHGQFGGLYMLATLASALTLPWLGRITDRYGAATVTLIIVPLLATGAVGMAFSAHLVVLVVVIYMLRLFGQGMMTQNALTATGRWFAANRGRAVSLVTLGHNAGEAVFPFAFVAVAAALGWRNAWLVAAAVLVIVALPAIAALTARERSPQSDAPDATAIAPRDWTRSEVMRDPLFWVLLTGVLAPPFIGTTIFFHQVYLVELRDWSLPVFASSFAVMSVTTIVFVLIAGALIDRFSATALLPVFLVPLSLACLALGLLDAQWSAFVFMALLGVSYGFSSTLFGAIWPEIYGTRQLGAIRAVIVAMMVFATAVGPGLTGALIDLGVSYPLQIVAMGVYCAGVAIVMTGASRRLLARRRAHVLANQPTVP